MAPRSIVARRERFGMWWLAVCAVVMGAPAGEANAKPRVERVIERRVVRLEAMERRMEAAAQMPPRPADVRRAIRRGEPVPPLGPDGTAAGSAAAGGPRGTPGGMPRTPAARPASPRPAPSTVARPGPQPAPRQPAAEPGLRFPEQADVTRRPASPAAAPETASGVTPATAVDDGTRSVLVGGEPTPAEPAELLPTPQPK